MGRKKKYFTREEQLKAQRKWNDTFYQRNKEDLNKTSMKKYYERTKGIKSSDIQDDKPN